MTLPDERTTAIMQTRKFLYALCDSKVTPSCPKVIREKARALLRHYPEAHDLKIINKSWNEPLIQMVMGDCPFGDPDEPL